MKFQRTTDEWLDFLARHRVRPTRSMGQNFLIVPDVVEDIVSVARTSVGDLVIEIGPGPGILTRSLLEAGAEVISVELDDDLAAILESDLADVPNFALIRQDARYLDPASLTGHRPYQVVANLPYSAGTVIIRNLLEGNFQPERMTVMVQKEVAERMAAEPGEMSLLGLAIQAVAEVELAFIVPPEVFMPPPKVDSAVAILTPKPQPAGTEQQRERMFALATLAFQRKRKTLANGLAQGLGRTKPDIEAALEAIGIDTRARPQALGLDDWLRVASALP